MPRQKSGCYRTRKSPCQSKSNCTWVIRKGCKTSGYRSRKSRRSPRRRAKSTCTRKRKAQCSSPCKWYRGEGCRDDPDAVLLALSAASPEIAAIVRASLSPAALSPLASPSPSASTIQAQQLAALLVKEYTLKTSIDNATVKGRPGLVLQLSGELARIRAVIAELRAAGVSPYRSPSASATSSASASLSPVASPGVQVSREQVQQLKLQLISLDLQIQKLKIKLYQTNIAKPSYTKLQLQIAQLQSYKTGLEQQIAALEAKAA